MASYLPTDVDEAEAVMLRAIDALSAGIASTPGEGGAALRRSIGELRAGFATMLRDVTFAAAFLDVFVSARQLGAGLTAFSSVRAAMLAEAPIGDIAIRVQHGAIMFALAQEARIISTMTFTSREDVESMMASAAAAFDEAAELAADHMDSGTYQNARLLGGAVIRSLAEAGRPLPRMVTRIFATTLPTLTIAQMVHSDAARAEEIAAENKVVHPAFAPRRLRLLGA